jgi:hypothetical protein
MENVNVRDTDLEWNTVQEIVWKWNRVFKEIQ